MRRINIFLVVVLVGIAFYYHFSGKAQQQQQIKEEQAKLLLQIKPDQIVSVGGKLSDQGFEIVKANGSWKMVSPVMDDANAEAVEETIKAIAELKYDSSFVPEDGNYAVFELENPKNVWNLKDAAGAIHTVQVGDINVMGSKGYVRLGETPSTSSTKSANANNVYLIDIADRNALVKKADDFRERKIFKGDPETLEEIAITKDGTKLVLAKLAGQWVMGEEGYPVNEDVIRKIRNDLADFSVKEFVRENLEGQETLIPKPMTVMLGFQDAKIEFVVENEPGKHDRNSIISGKERIVSLDGNFVANFEQKPDDYRRKKLFALQPHEVIGLTVERNDTTIELKQQDKAWLLNTTLKADGGKVRYLLDSFTALEAADFHPTVSPDDLEKVATITITGQEARQEKAEIFRSKSKQNEFYSPSLGRGGMVLLKAEKPADFLVTQEGLEERKVFPFRTEEINSVLVRMPGKADKGYKREGAVWKSGETEKPEITGFLWMLQEISWLERNAEIPKGAIAKAELELTRGKEVEKVQVFAEGFCSVKGKKYKLSVDDVGKITDFLNKL